MLFVPMLILAQELVLLLEPGPPVDGAAVAGESVIAGMDDP